MEKLYNRIDWHNNTSPAINETNLNRMSKAVDDIDNRVVGIAGTVMETVPQIQEDLAEAQELIEDAEELTAHPPVIGQNGHWWTWDTSIDDYADSGVDAGVSLSIGTTSTLTPGSDATVTNSGTATDPILNFGIPAGVAGQNGQDGADGEDGADGVSPTVTIGTITGGHSVTITDADHPTGQTFNVMDGTNGQGVPASGTTGQVLTKASNADYDTTWTTPSGGSGGHTILNGSGSAMNQRSKLQFDGATVTDDSANDKTIVTTTPQSMIGDAWVTSHAYAVGDYCIDGNVLYKCKTAHTSSASNRPPYASYWDAVSVSSQLGGGGVDLSVFDDLSSFTSFELYNENRIIDFDGRYKKIGNLVYLYATFNEIDKTKFSPSNIFDYWRLTKLNNNIPAPVHRFPCFISDPHGGFQSAFVDTAENNDLYFAICEVPDNYDNTKTNIYFRTVVMGIYTTNQ